MSAKPARQDEQETELDPEAQSFIDSLDAAFARLQKIAEEKPEVALAVCRNIDTRLGQRTSHCFTDAAMAPARKVLGRKVRRWERWEGMIWGTLGGVGIHTVATKLVPKAISFAGRLIKGGNSDTPDVPDAPVLEVVSND